MDLSIHQLQRALGIRKHIAQLEKQLGKLFGSSTDGASPKRSGKRKVSKAARAKMAASQKARWAKTKGAPTAPAKRGKKKGITAAGRKRLSENMKARWAAKKKAKPKKSLQPEN